MSEVKLVPAKMLLDKETIGAINFHCGDGGDNFGEHSDGLLWVGVVTDDEGVEVYGLHLATAEYPEEGSTTLVEFQAPEDAVQSELAALREELVEIKESLAYRGSLLNRTQLRAESVEQRNAELIAAMERIHFRCESFSDEALGMQKNSVRVMLDIAAKALAKPTESGASE